MSEIEKSSDVESSIILIPIILEIFNFRKNHIQILIVIKIFLGLLHNCCGWLSKEFHPRQSSEVLFYLCHCVSILDISSVGRMLFPFWRICELTITENISFKWLPSYHFWAQFWSLLYLACWFKWNYTMRGTSVAMYYYGRLYQ